MRNFLGRKLAPKQTINLSSPQEKDILGLFRERVVCFEDAICSHLTPTEEAGRHCPCRPSEWITKRASPLTWTGSCKGKIQKIVPD